MKQTGVLSGFSLAQCLVRQRCLVRYMGVVALSLLLAGCFLDQEPTLTYLPLEFHGNDRLPLVPHVRAVRARPTVDMVSESAGTFLRFMVLDKRTLNIHRLVASVGKRYPAPWGGTLYPTAFVSDFVIREGQAIHGPQGHFNPGVWILLEDGEARPLYEGWMLARDATQTAWDHPRFDLTFLGITDAMPEAAQSSVADSSVALHALPTPSNALPVRRRLVPLSHDETQESLDTLLQQADDAYTQELSH